MGFLETKKMTSATAKTVKVFDGLLIWQGRFLGLKIYWRPKFQTQCSFLLRDERLEFSSRSRPIRSSTGRIQINNANHFICHNIFRSLSMTGANTWQEAREGTPLVALYWLERRYEIYTSKSLGRERSKSWAKSVVSNFRRSLRVASPRNFARTRVYFAHPTIGIAKIRDYSQSTTNHVSYQKFLN